MTFGLKRQLITVGCGGNRDKTKLIMASIASELSDKVFLLLILKIGILILLSRMEGSVAAENYKKALLSDRKQAIKQRVN
jgi:hypothetical protein